MKFAVFTVMFMMAGNAFAASRDFIRFSGERLLTGAAVGTRDIWAGQMDMEPFHLGSFAVGVSARKEGGNITDGWGVGLYASKTWLDNKQVNIVTDAGARWFIPTVEYFNFRYREQDGRVVWQRWERASANAWPRFFPGEERRMDGAAVAPVLGLHVQRRAGRFSFRAGVRATAVRFTAEVAYRAGERPAAVRDNYWRFIVAPAFSVGF